MKKTLLFIPMYNCEKQIGRVLRQLTGDVCAYLDEVIVVNNRSTDKSEESVWETLSEYQPPVKVSLLRNRDNYGLGGSHKVAFQYAADHGFDYVIVLHGDDQGSIRDLLPYLKNGEAYTYDSFLGSRFEKESRLINYSAFRIFGNHVFNTVMSVILRRKITDLGSGLNMYSTDYLRSGFYRGFIDTLTFNVYMLIYGVYSGSQFCFFPLEWREEDQVSNAKFVKQSFEIFKIALRYRMRPRKVFSESAAGSRKTYESDAVWQILPKKAEKQEERE